MHDKIIKLIAINLVRWSHKSKWRNNSIYLPIRFFGQFLHVLCCNNITQNQFKSHFHDSSALAGCCWWPAFSIYSNPVYNHHHHFWPAPIRVCSATRSQQPATSRVGNWAILTASVNVRLWAQDHLPQFQNFAYHPAHTIPSRLGHPPTSTIKSSTVDHSRHLSAINEMSWG